MADIAITISDLTESAVRLQPELKLLPVTKIQEELGILGMNLLPGIQHEDVIHYLERKGGIGMPYNGTVADGLVGKAIKRSLKVETCYARIKDNIQNYRNTIVGPDVLLGKNQSKTHPWKDVIVRAVVATFGEDLLDALFHGTRDDSGDSVLDMFDGFFTKIAADVSSGLIDSSLWNQQDTGALANVSGSSYEVYTDLLTFWQGAHPGLKKQNTLMLVSPSIKEALDLAHFNKFGISPIYDAYNRITLMGTENKCRVVANSALGSGSQIILTVPGNMDFGVDTDSDANFVQVWPDNDDPNVVKFWIQGSYGVRIRSLNGKVFCTNDQVNTPVALAGDYS